MISSLVKKLLALLGIAVLLFLNIFVWHNFGLGAVLVLGFIFLMSGSARSALIKFFNFGDNGRTRILGAFLVFTVLSWLSGATVVFYKLTPLTIAVIFFITGLVFIFWELWAKLAKGTVPAEPAEVKESPFGLPTVFWGGLVFLVFAGYGFYLLYHSQSGAALVSPWQTINPNYIWIFLGATFLLGVLIFSRLSVKTLLIFLTVYIFLLLSYLPLTHQLFYGADQWRHLATESRIMSQLPTDIVAPNAAQPLFLTSAPGNIFYSSFWGINVVLAQVLNLDLISLVRWFLPVLWALIFPVLIYEIGLAINLNKKESLFLVWLTALPFALQYAGALSIPNHFGLLIWLLLVLLILKVAVKTRWEQFVILAVLGLLSVFGYGLYLLLFWLAALVFVILSPALAGRRIFSNFRFFASLRMTATIILVAIFIPAVELIVKYSTWPKQVDWFAQVKQLFGNLTGWYLATGPRPHDILTGNIFFNQVPLGAFVPNFLTQHPIWIFIFMILVWYAILVGVIFSLRSKATVRNWLGVMFLGLLGSYIIGRYILTGGSIITRRLDGVLAILGIIFLLFGLKQFVDWLTKKFHSQRAERIIMAVLVVIFSLAIAASYSLGPDIRAMSVDEYKAAKYVWGEQARCVITDTYPLLALEYFSKKQVTGGGFSMGQNFSQPERVKLYEEMKADPKPAIFDEAKNITGAINCYLIANTKEIYYNNYTYQTGKEWKMFGDMIVWQSKSP